MKTSRLALALAILVAASSFVLGANDALVGAVVVCRDGVASSGFIILSQEEKEAYELEEWPGSGFGLPEESGITTPSGQVVSGLLFTGWRENGRATVRLLLSVPAEGEVNQVYPLDSESLTRQEVAEYQLKLGDQVTVDEARKLGFEPPVEIQAVENLGVLSRPIVHPDAPCTRRDENR